MSCSSSSAWAELCWQEGDAPRSALWRADAGLPRRVEVVDDSLSADQAFRLASEGTALLWRGDFQNARQLLLALGRRWEKRQSTASKRRSKAGQSLQFPHGFHLYRQAQAQRARLLGSLLIELDQHWHCSLRRAPDWSQACQQAFGVLPGKPVVMSLRDLLGALGASEWRKKGVELSLPDLPAMRIHPHYGVFSPVRGEYLELVARAALPRAALLEADQGQARVWDIGVGTGVLTALLLRRGVPRVVATDLSDQALACAEDNLQRLGLGERASLLKTDLFPEGRAALIVCNPPWLPGKPGSRLEQAVYDEGSRMLRGFLQGLGTHLLPDGQAWLIVSDLAEHLCLRTREELLGWISDAGLQVLGRDDIRPRHGKAADESDPLHKARAAELTSLWRLGLAQSAQA
ncbi:N5-glutamine methyltransferase family protein [Comamonas composti]|uniref:N5-glutamine methyltransferase family protein n=1 Tax=Comamonas composti TaxID=408558 RepID=UPI00047A9195|nr:class I SAM-dependent methyltransferase [Comamonas composti]